MRFPPRILIVLTLIVLAGACGRERSRSSSDPDRSWRLQLLTERAAAPSYASSGEGAAAWKQVRRFYHLNGYHLAWIANGRATRRLNQLIEVLEAAERDALDPADYDVSRMRQLRASLAKKEEDTPLPEARVAELDAWLTHRFMRYAAHLSSGTIDPRRIDGQWRAAPHNIDLAAVLVKRLEEGSLEAVAEDLAPKHPEYAALRETLARYKELRDTRAWPVVHAPAGLKAGMSSPMVPAFRARLAASGDFAPSRRAAANPLFDPALAEALKNFQSRHGLEAHGVLDRETLAALNVPIATRIEQIRLNMDRWRWLPDDLGPRYIRLNIPAFRLDLIEDGRIVMDQRVIVGKTSNRTPVFSDEMTNIVFSPYWNIPESIVANETLPRALEDPGFLERNHIEVVRGTSGEAVDPTAIDWTELIGDSSVRLRQKPGPGNSLGLVKFVFPNHFNVYLHDTPADSLFTRIERDFSHGCVRLEEPIELARAVLRDQPQWTTERITAAMHSGREQTVKLRQPIPVHLVYFTVMPYDNGAVQFREDLYGYDSIQARLARGKGR